MGSGSGRRRGIHMRIIREISGSGVYTRVQGTLIRTGIIAFVVTLGMASSSAYAGCALAGGEAVMVTEDLTKCMAGAALKHSF